MNKNQQQLYRDISELTKAVQKLVKLLTKIAPFGYIIVTGVFPTENPPTEFKGFTAITFSYLMYLSNLLFCE